MFSSLKKRGTSTENSSLVHAGDMKVQPLSSVGSAMVGDGYFASKGVAPSYHDQPETDYDLGPSTLYSFIEQKLWDSAIERARNTPSEAKTWISRREPSDPNKIRWRLLPLHATCVFRAPLSLIETLITAYPDGPKMIDDQGMLPLHLACRNGASRAVVMTLLNTNPESINAKDKKGRTPLNLVESSNSQNKDQVIEAIQSFRVSHESGKLPPVGTGIRAITPCELNATLANGCVGEREVDYENRTILFRLILKKDWEGVSKRLNTFPDEAMTWIVTKGYNGNLRFLPLHKACVLTPPPAIIEGLIKAFPDAVKRSDQDGWLPLHCACFYGAPAESIEKLILAYPKAAQVKDDDSRLPLHYACLKSAPDSVVNKLLSAHVKGALAKDNDGRMPLHHACAKAADDKVIETLVRLGPKALQSKDNNGRIPLHLACKKGVTTHGLNHLLQCHPRGAAAKDDQEKLPVHHACQSGACSPAAVLMLLDAHPESIHSRTAFGLTPHDEACQPKQGVNMDPIKEVLRRFKQEQERLGGTNNGSVDNARFRDLEDRVAFLTNKTEMMSKALTGVVQIAAQLKSDIADKKSDGKVEIQKFCDSIMRLKIE
jgi:ankyrin repeat protein